MTTTKGAAAAAARGAIEKRTAMLFEEAGAFRAGHFALKSGRHADRYLEKFQVLQFPGAVTELCGYVAARVRDDEGRPTVDLVAGPTTGGVVLAFETARQLGVRGIFAEEVAVGDGRRRRAFRRGFEIHPGERVLLVDDVLTTGGSLAAMLPPIEEAGGEVVEAAVLVDRAGGMTEITSPASGRRYALRALWTLDLPTWESGADCPGCRAGQPVTSPGATGAGTTAGGSG